MTNWEYWEYGVIINDVNDPHNGMLWRVYRELANAEYMVDKYPNKYKLQRRHVTKTPWVDLP